jgi:hypothetical protein
MTPTPRSLVLTGWFGIAVAPWAALFSANLLVPYV